MTGFALARAGLLDRLVSVTVACSAGRARAPSTCRARQPGTAEDSGTRGRGTAQGGSGRPAGARYGLAMLTPLLLPRRSPVFCPPQGPPHTGESRQCHGLQAACVAPTHPAPRSALTASGRHPQCTRSSLTLARLPSPLRPLAAGGGDGTGPLPAHGPEGGPCPWLGLGASSPASPCPQSRAQPGRRRTGLSVPGAVLCAPRPPWRVPCLLSSEAVIVTLLLPEHRLSPL